MAVETATLASANKKSLYRAIQRESTRRHNSPLRPRGTFTFERDFTIATTYIDDAGDEARLIEFPDGVVYLDELKIEATDMDANGAPALVFDIITDDGTTELVLINDSTIGQAGGTDELDANVDPDSLSVGGKYLSLKTGVAAATPAAGTLTVRFKITIDPITTW